MPPIEITYLGGPDIDALNFTDVDILTAIESSLVAQGSGETVIEPRAHLMPNPEFRGHFNVLRGYISSLGAEDASLRDGGLAGVKIVGDFVDNYKIGFPSELALLNLMDARTGAPRAIIDASKITDMRTGAITAIGAKYLARKGSKILGHIGARGTAYWNVRLLDHLFDFDEIRVHSRRPESRDAFGAQLTEDLGKPVIVTDNWQDCLDGADILVEASRLEKPEPIFKTEWVKPGALVVPYGTHSTVEDDLPDIMDKIVVDDWGQCLIGPFGCFRRHVDRGQISRESIHGELGQICNGSLSGRERDDETILLWHRGLSTSDISLGYAMLQKAEAMGLGTRLPYRA